jgi:hypothetical protein
MLLTRGAPRSLDDSQIRRVLKWHARRQRFLEEFGTARDVAKREGIPLSLVRRWLRRPMCVAGRKVGRRSPGRPEKLTTPQRLTLARWRRGYLRYVNGHPSAAQLADELGVSRFTIFDCIKRNGRYVQRPQEKTNMKPPAKPVGRGTEHDSASNQRADLLKTWTVADANARRVGSKR